jgi:hypothetical protein
VDFLDGKRLALRTGCFPRQDNRPFVLATRICARILGQLLLGRAPDLVERLLRTAAQACGVGFGDAGNSERSRAMGLGILRFTPMRGLSGRRRSLIDLGRIDIHEISLESPPNCHRAFKR